MKKLARLVRYLQHAYVDLRLFATGKADPDLPPLRLRFVGAGDFRTTGEHLADLLRDVGGLSPSHHVLDMGCGVGRVALALRTRLGPAGRYEGFDVVQPWVRWCQRHISRCDPRFSFRHAPVQNPEYNPRGIRATEYHFPYAPARFDLAFATSLFTHLAVEETAHYLAEAARVLAPEGRLVASFFLLDERAAVHPPTPGFEFPVDLGRYHLRSAENPADAIALDRTLLDELLAGAGLELLAFHPGAWCGGTGLSFQDFIVARPASPSAERPSPRAISNPPATGAASRSSG